MRYKHAKMNRRSRRKKVSKKYRWHDNKGRRLSGGGLLIYDSEGVWFVGEKKNNSIVFTDPGGKYRFEDCDIFTTVAREVMEELYNTVQVTGAHIESISEKEDPIYVHDHLGRPTYVCFLVEVETFEKLTNSRLEPDRFLRSRTKTLCHNPEVPEDKYNTVSLVKMPFHEIADYMNDATRSNTLNYRVKQILQQSKLSERTSRPPGFTKSDLRHSDDVPAAAVSHDRPTVRAGGASGSEGHVRAGGARGSEGPVRAPSASGPSRAEEIHRLLRLSALGRSIGRRRHSEPGRTDQY